MAKQIGLQASEYVSALLGFLLFLLAVVALVLVVRWAWRLPSKSASRLRRRGWWIVGIGMFYGMSSTGGLTPRRPPPPEAAQAGGALIAFLIIAVGVWTVAKARKVEDEEVVGVTPAEAARDLRQDKQLQAGTHTPGDQIGGHSELQEHLAREHQVSGGELGGGTAELADKHSSLHVHSDDPVSSARPTEVVLTPAAGTPSDATSNKFSSPVFGIAAVLALVLVAIVVLNVNRSESGDVSQGPVVPPGESVSPTTGIPVAQGGGVVATPGSWRTHRGDSFSLEYPASWASRDYETSDAADVEGVQYAPDQSGVEGGTLFEGGEISGDIVLEAYSMKGVLAKVNAKEFVAGFRKSLLRSDFKGPVSWCGEVVATRLERVEAYRFSCRDLSSSFELVAGMSGDTTYVAMAMYTDHGCLAVLKCGLVERFFKSLRPQAATS